MKLQQFKKITNIFKSQNTLDKELAIHKFYNTIKEHGYNNDVQNMMSQYFSAGFTIKREHIAIINEDPYNILCRTIKDKAIIMDIWNDYTDPKYKTYLHQEVPAFKTFILKGKKLEKGDLERLYNNVFATTEIFNFYTNIVYDGKTEIKGLKDSFRKLSSYFVHYPSLHREDINTIEILKNKVDMKGKIEKDDTEYTVSENLTRLFSEDRSIVKQKEEVYTNNTFNSMIRTLKRYSPEFNAIEGHEQKIFSDILDNVTQVSGKQLATHSEEYMYLNNLLHKHLPELLSEYFEIPEKIRMTYKDDKGKTPYNVFSETLNTINKKVKETCEEVFNENFVNIKVKNRVMKMN